MRIKFTPVFFIEVFFNVLKTCAHTSAVKPPKFSSSRNKIPTKTWPLNTKTFFLNGDFLSLRVLRQTLWRLTAGPHRPNNFKTRPTPGLQILPKPRPLIKQTRRTFRPRSDENIACGAEAANKTAG